MNLWFRTFLTLLFARFRSKLDLLDLGEMPVRCWPTDIDIAMHMNNGRYLSIADLGRFDFMVRTGFWKETAKYGWYPVVGTSRTWHRRSLRTFQKAILTTKVIGWDEKWIYIEHRFEVGDTLYAQIIVKTLFLKKGQKIPTSKLIEALGYTGPKPDLPESVLNM